MTTRKRRTTRTAGPVTLAIDIGGSGLKAMLLSSTGKPLTERFRVETPRPATPRAVMGALRKLVPAGLAFDRVSVGFPGVVADGVVRTAPNLHRSWSGFDLAGAIRRSTRRPTLALNDAGVQGHGAIRGKGVEVCVTLGTGFGFALFVDGHYVPNVELGHHPFRKGRTYEEHLGAPALERLGRNRWNRVLSRVIQVLDRTFNYRTLYLGGGNARKVTLDLPTNVKTVDNVAGLLGGVKLWERVAREKANVDRRH
jgi:polyphosphate glucokinase